MLIHETRALTQSSSSQSMGLFNNPAQLLNEFSNAKSTGRLKIFSEKTVWNFYLQDGQLLCASNATQSLESLDYHLRCLGLKEAVTALKEMPPQPQTQLAIVSRDWLHDNSIKQILSLLQAQGLVDAMHLSKLLENLTKEAIESFLWLTQAHYQWLPGESKPSWKEAEDLHLELHPLIRNCKTRQQAWRQLSNLIRSPHERVYLAAQARQDIALQPSSPLSKISQLLRGLTIRQIALILNEDELRVAKLLYPYIQRGEVYLREAPAPLDDLPTIPKTPVGNLEKIPATKTYKVACIDDSPTILDEMQKFLGNEDYEVTKINDPVKAASMLFRLKPDLILMDITMPEINGYKLCNLLRNSVALREVPIIMVTGRTGFIDKAKAKLHGATDYLIKPFTRGSLLVAVEKYLA